MRFDQTIDRKPDSRGAPRVRPDDLSHCGVPYRCRFLFGEKSNCIRAGAAVACNVLASEGLRRLGRNADDFGLGPDALLFI